MKNVVISIYSNIIKFKSIIGGGGGGVISSLQKRKSYEGNKYAFFRPLFDLTTTGVLILRVGPESNLTKLRVKHLEEYFDRKT